MSSATALLGLALPVTGSLSGLWGNTVNDSITSLLDSAVAGTTTISTNADVTLTTTELGANEARQAVLLFSGARTALRTVTAPAHSKTYVVINATTGGYAVQLVGVGPTTGVTIASGTAVTVVWNGSDFIATNSDIVTLTAAQTLTNKNVVKRTVVVASATSITPDSATTDVLTQANTGIAGTLTINAPTGSPTNGQNLILRISSTAVQTFAWNAIYQGSTDLPLPTSTTGSSKTDYLGVTYNSTTNTWQLLAKNFGF